MDSKQLLLLLSEFLGVIAVTMLLGLSPRFKVRPIDFRYPRREGMLSLTIFSIMLGFATLYFSLNLLPAPVFTASLPELYPLERRAMLALLSTVLIVAALTIRRQPIRSAGWNPAAFRGGLQLGFALLLITIFLNQKIFAILDGLTSAEIIGLLLCTVLVVIEETIFRGFIQMRLISWLGKTPGWIASAFLFTLWHFPGSGGLNSPQQWLSFGIIFAQGLLLGWVARRSSSVLPGSLYRIASLWMGFLQ